MPKFYRTKIKGLRLASNFYCFNIYGVIVFLSLYSVGACCFCCGLQALVVSCLYLVDSTRCLLGDSRGRLFMLFVECDGGKCVEGVERVTGLKLELLGEVVSPSTLAYLDNGVVFVGSTFGDPQLVKVS